jgi:hypothetical protein
MQMQFFRWRLVAIALWMLGALYGVTAAVDWWIWSLATRGAINNPSIFNTRLSAHVYFHGGVADSLITILCIVGWYLMRRRTSRSFCIGACAVAFSFLITAHRWLHWEVIGPNDGDWIEPLLIWPFFLYVILYACLEIKARIS